MAEVDIDKLQIEIEASSSQASKQIFQLANSLRNLKNSLSGGGIKLSHVAKQIEALKAATSTMGDAPTKIKELSGALHSLSTLPNAGNFSKYVNGLRDFPKIAAGLSSLDFKKTASEIQSVMSAIQPLSNLPPAKAFAGYIQNLKKLPKVMEDLEKIDLSKLAIQMQDVANAIKPLADQMDKVAKGFAAFPQRIQQFIQSGQKMPSAGKNITSVFRNIRVKALAYLFVFGNIKRAMADWFMESNEYVENLNLFTVSMGKYAKSAKEYAETVQEVLGIDPSEWMRNQGIFMQIASGFGVVSDKANLMSKNLTQLGYDISSFYNISVETAMLKVQSGLSGELEPLILAA